MLRSVHAQLDARAACTRALPSTAIRSKQPVVPLTFHALRASNIWSVLEELPSAASRIRIHEVLPATSPPRNGLSKVPSADADSIFAAR
mmetsp:Transcript_41522/g.163399  ORF Transcript_41522/g.163399 Transcript_41522/m.163399 type:complete len:89 (-) Transcript_41522:648-914(-)